jgi:hypothetical protein
MMLSIDTADARTALSIAGVHRRGHRRAARSAIYAGAVGAVVAYYGGNGYPAYSYSAPYYGTGYDYGSH